MKPEPLNEDELSLVKHDGDKIVLEIIKGMSLQELRYFDIYKPIDLMHYNSIQCLWLYTEKHLLDRRDGTYREATEEELINDINKFHNGERFRVFYVLTFPYMVLRQNII